MAVDYLADLGVVGIVGGGERGSSFLGFLFVLKEGVACHVLGAFSLLHSVGGRVATFAEFVLELCHGLVGILGGGTDFLAVQELAVRDVLDESRGVIGIEMQIRVPIGGFLVQGCQ